MAKYHVNSTTGNVGTCSAKPGNCPFGGEDAHFTSAAAARQAYEASQDNYVPVLAKSFKEKFPFIIADDTAALAYSIGPDGKLNGGSYARLTFTEQGDSVTVYGARKELLKYLESTRGSADVKALSLNPDYVPATPTLAPKAASVTQKHTKMLTTAPTSAAELYAAIETIVPEPQDSKVLSPPAVNDDEGYMGGRRYIGALAQKAKDKAASEGKFSYVSQTEAAAGIRKLVAAAKAAGELPKWLDVSVRKNSGAWVTSIGVELGYKPAGSTKGVSFPRSWIAGEAKDSYSREHPAMVRLNNYVSHLARHYENSDINSMVDYFSSSNAGRVSWKY